MVIALTVALVEDTVLRAMKHAVVDVLEVYVSRRPGIVHLDVSTNQLGNMNYMFTIDHKSNFFS